MQRKIIITRILINKYNYVEIELGMLLVVVLLTVSVSSCKDMTRKRRSENKKEVSIFIPIGLKELRSLIWQK
jgi:hypothetical protein